MEIIVLPSIQEKLYNQKVFGGALWDLRTLIGRSMAERLILLASQFTPHAFSFSDFYDYILIADDYEYEQRKMNFIIQAFNGHGIPEAKSIINKDDIKIERNEAVKETQLITNLEQNYPNPFNPTTDISFQIAKLSKVTLEIFDILGRKIAELVNGIKEPGQYRITWDAKGFPSGIYICRLKADNYIQTKQMFFMK